MADKIANLNTLNQDTTTVTGCKLYRRGNVVMVSCEYSIQGGRTLAPYDGINLGTVPAIYKPPINIINTCFIRDVNSVAYNGIVFRVNADGKVWISNNTGAPINMFQCLCTLTFTV